MAYQEVFKRVEMKYVLPPDRMSTVREAMEGRMALDRYGLSEIRNLYCDTPSWILARRSIEKPVYKEKVRVRSYGPASGEDTVFLELKKKYDGIVYKRRMAGIHHRALRESEADDVSGISEGGVRIHGR